MGKGIKSRGYEIEWVGIHNRGMKTRNMGSTERTSSD